jgi:hypothetical protein
MTTTKEPSELSKHAFRYGTQAKLNNEAIDFVMSYFEQSFEVDDLRKDKTAQTMGVDFRVNNRSVILIRDSSIGRTGNVALEILANSNNGERGLLFKSQAELLFVYDPENHKIHSMRLSALREWIITSPTAIWKTVKASTSGPKNTVKYCSFSLLVALLDVQGIDGIDYKVHDLSKFWIAKNPPAPVVTDVRASNKALTVELARGGETKQFTFDFEW